MANIVQFLVDDPSPFISYEPIGDTLSLPDLNAGWNPFFTNSGFATAQGALGNGTSLHVTSRDGAKLTVTWRGISIQLQGNVTNANYTVELDGSQVTDIGADMSSNILATIQGLPNTLHTVSLVAKIPPNQNPPESRVSFDRAIIAARPPNVTPTTASNVYSIKSLNAQSIAFSGRWSFESQGNVSIHRTEGVGDRAVASFRGTAFLLRGTTSPDAGRYSVTLNNETVSLSAKSSFLSRSTLLYYATSLDPNTTHTVAITNEGDGSLSLLEEGFQVFSDGPPDPVTPTPGPPVVVVPNTFNKGTIAAFALGGILACVILCGALYYFFIFRSRRQFKRQRELWRRQFDQSPPLGQGHRHKATGESLDSVIDIRASTPSTTRGQPNRDLEEVLGLKHPSDEQVHPNAPGRSRGGLGALFRNNGNSGNEKYTYTGTLESESDPMSSSTRSSPRFRASLMIRKAGLRMTSHSGRSKSGGGKNGNGGSRSGNGNGNTNGSSSGKGGDRNVSDHRSWSPSYQINLPFQRPSQEEMEAKAASTLGSLSYLTNPAIVGRHEAEPSGDTYMHAPPSYAASVMTRGEESSPLSVPRSVGQGSSYPTSAMFSSTKPTTKGKRKSDDLLSSDPNRGSGGQLTSPHTDHGSLTSELTPPFPIRELSKEDRGSIYDQSIDEDPKLLGGSAVRQVIRSLSPRTSKASFLPRRSFHQGLSRREATSSMEMEPIRVVTDVQHRSSAQPSPVVPLVASPTGISPTQTQPPPLFQRDTRPLPPLPSSPPATIESHHAPPTVQEASDHENVQPQSQREDQQDDTRLQLRHSITPPTPSVQSDSDHGGIWISSRQVSGQFSLSVQQQLAAATNRASLQSTAPPSSIRFSATRFDLPPQPHASTSRKPFRLTPASYVPFPRQETPLTNYHYSDEHVRDSFLDFTVSSDVSTISNNGYTDNSSAQDVRRYSTPPQVQDPLPEERSRWSSTNSAGISIRYTYALPAGSIEEGGDIGSSGSGSGGPERGSGPVKGGDSNGNGEGAQVDSGGEKTDSGGSSSGKGSNGSAARSQTSQVPANIKIPRNSQFLSPHRRTRISATSGSSSRSDPVHVHPPLDNMESPTDSIPMSASEVNFQYSDSEDHSNARPMVFGPGPSPRNLDRDSLPMSPFHAVPPSPSDGHALSSEGHINEASQLTPLPTGLSSPNYLVQRVLGLNSPASVATPRPPEPHRARSRSGSTSAFFTTPLSARFDSNVSTGSRGGATDPDHPRTM